MESRNLQNQQRNKGSELAHQAQVAVNRDSYYVTLRTRIAETGPVTAVAEKVVMQDTE